LSDVNAVNPIDAQPETTTQVTDTACQKAPWRTPEVEAVEVASTQSIVNGFGTTDLGIYS
jgi:hypothetical protein